MLNSFMTMATFSSWNSIKKAHHVDRCLTMKVRIIEKIYHHTNSPILSTPYRTDRELFWIKELGTAMPYGSPEVQTIWCSTFFQLNYL
jgi:hypothetical protein